MPEADAYPTHHADDPTAIDDEYTDDRWRDDDAYAGAIDWVGATDAGLGGELWLTTTPDGGEAPGEGDTVIRWPERCGRALRDATVGEFMAGVPIRASGRELTDGNGGAIEARTITIRRGHGRPDGRRPTRNMAQPTAGVTRSMWITGLRRNPATNRLHVEGRRDGPQGRAQRVALDAEQWAPLADTPLRALIRARRIRIQRHGGQILAARPPAGDGPAWRDADPELIDAHRPHPKHTLQAPWGIDRLPGASRDRATWHPTVTSLARAAVDACRTALRNGEDAPELRLWGPFTSTALQGAPYARTPDDAVGHAVRRISRADWPTWEAVHAMMPRPPYGPTTAMGLSRRALLDIEWDPPLDDEELPKARATLDRIERDGAAGREK